MVKPDPTFPSQTANGILQRSHLAVFKIKPKLTPFAVVIRLIQADSGGYLLPLLRILACFRCHGMDHIAFRKIRPQLAQCVSVKTLCTAGRRSFESRCWIFEGGLCRQGVDASTGHDGIPLLQIPLLFLGKLLKCCRDRLCLYSVPENFGVVPAIVTRHIRSVFLIVIILFRAVEENRAAPARGNGQQFIRRSVYVPAPALDGKLRNDICMFLARIVIDCVNLTYTPALREVGQETSFAHHTAE